MLREIVEARGKDYKVFFQKDTLWVAYGEGSGTTSYMPDYTRALSNKNGDETYDTNVDKIVLWASFNKPLKSNKDKDVFLFEIPFYDLGSPYDKLDIWGGDKKPKKKFYMIVSTGEIAVVNLFDSKAEAMSWMRSV